MRIFCFLLLIFLSASLFGQSIQELEEQLNAATTSNERMQLNYQIGEAYLNSNVRQKGNEALPYAKTAHNLARDNGNNGLAAQSAYLLGRIYEVNRNERNQEVWFRTAESYAKRANDLDLIVKSVIKRGELASRDRNYRRAAQIYEEAFNFFSAQGTSISELARQYEMEKAKLEAQKQQLEADRTALAEEITTLRLEKGQLLEDKTELEETQEVLIQEKEKVEEEIVNKEEELETVEAAKQEAEQLAEQRQEVVELLSRDTLEQRYRRMQAENAAQEAQARATQIRDLSIIIIIIATFLVLFFLNRFLSKRRAARVLEEKNTIIESERKRSDDLLLNILPVQIADELKTTGKAKARRFEKVSVLFSDFRNFTNMAEEMSPEELVEQLDLAFKGFDRIIGDYPEIDKIKTIGDAYMCASGLNQNATPNSLVKAALEMQAFLNRQALERQKLGKAYFEARIGIHTGPVVAGVVGSKKFAYDIWGDTVNTASRIETNSEVGKVNISETTYNLIKYDFNCTYRGRIQAKNKGEIEMYYVEGLR